MIRSLAALGFLFPLFALGSAPQWKPVQASVPMQAITFGTDGTTYAISPQGTLLSRPARASAWSTELPRGVFVKFAGVSKDGTLIVLDAKLPKIYAKSGGVWSTHDGFAEQMLRSMNGTSFARFADGRVSNSSGAWFQAKFRSISLPTKTEGLFLAGMDGKLYIYEIGSSGQPTEIVGKGSGRMLVGTGTGTRGSMFALGAGADALVYFFEVSPTNKWVPITGGPGMKFIAMSPQGILHGIDLNNKLHWLDAKF